MISITEIIIIRGVEKINMVFNNTDRRKITMKGFAKRLVQHRILVIILCIALVVPSVPGLVRTKTKYDTMPLSIMIGSAQSFTNLTILLT